METTTDSKRDEAHWAHNFEFALSVEAPTHASPGMVDTAVVMRRSYTRLDHGFKQLDIPLFCDCTLGY
jgi:hypothetical protein